MNEVTRILDAIEQGDPQAAGRLLPLVYGELRKLAAQRLAQEKPGQTLQATALVHEAYLRLVVPAGAAQADMLARSTGTTAGISSPRLRRPCAESSSKTPAANTAKSAAAGGPHIALDERSSFQRRNGTSALWRWTRHWSDSSLLEPDKAELLKLRFLRRAWSRCRGPPCPWHLTQHRPIAGGRTRGRGCGSRSARKKGRGARGELRRTAPNRRARP